MPSSSKLAAVAVAGAGAYAVSTAFVGPARASATSTQHQQGSVAGRSISNVCTLGAACTISGVVLAGCGVVAQKRTKRSAKIRAQALAQGAEEEPAFTEGQQVRILAPPAMAGKMGSVVGPAISKDTWKIRTESGNVFEFQTQNLQDIAAAFADLVAAPPVAPTTAAAPAAAAQATGEELEFEEGQQVRILAPPAMAGKMGSIVGPALSKDTWKVRTESGNVFEFTTQNLQATAPAYA